MAKSNYNLVVTIEPIVIANGDTAKAQAAQKFMKAANRWLGRTLAWFLNGEVSGKDIKGRQPAMTLTAAILGPDGKVTKSVPVEGFGVAAKDNSYTFNVKDREAGPSFDLDAFLADK